MVRDDPATILRTANDAIHAKLSALEHYNCTATCENIDTETSYVSLLRSMARTIESSKDAGTTVAITSPRQVRRQTPLINIGYAMRIACMKYTIQQFVQFHSYRNEKCQIVILGAGWDVIGLWLLLSKVELRLRCTIHIIEVDFPSLCSAKKEALKSHLHHGQESGFSVHDQSTESNKDNNLNIVFHARRNHRNGPDTGDSRDDADEYCLIAGDLHNRGFVDHLFAKISQNRQVSTLVVSELVLAYLRPEACDHILRCIANSGCSLLAYEPMLSETVPGNQPCSILESYQQSYLQKFDDKLNSGKAATSTRDSLSSLLHPLGSSLSEIRNRLGEAGFRQIDAGRLGNVAVRLKTWKSNEMFDEHAALALHAASYVVICAFPDTSSNDAPSYNTSLPLLILRRWMCGRTISNHYCGKPRWKGMSDTPISIWITSIECADEREVRSLFSETYKEIAEDYPAVRKMVKNALRTSLGSNGVANTESDVEPVKEDSSVIRQRFRDVGGDFLVILDTSSSSTVDGRNRRVLGGIGFRLCNHNEKFIRGITADGTIPCYEIHHMFVDRTYQQKGLGKALLKATIEVLQDKHRRYGKPLVLVATTLSILKSANEFYTSKGFVLKGEEQKGELQYRDFVLKIASTIK